MKRLIKMVLRFPFVFTRAVVSLIFICPIIFAQYWLKDDDRTLRSAARVAYYEWRWFLTRKHSAEDDAWWDKRCDAARRMT